MEIKQDVTLMNLADMLWSGGADTMQEILDLDKGDELMDFLEEMYMDNIPDLTDINDLLWFERNYVLESLGVELDEDGEIVTDENRKLELEVTLLSQLGEDEDYTSCDWHLIGFDLYHGDDLMGEVRDSIGELDHDKIAEIILNFEHDFVSLIEIVETSDIVFENPEEFERDEEE